MRAALRLAGGEGCGPFPPRNFLGDQNIDPTGAFPPAVPRPGVSRSTIRGMSDDLRHLNPVDGLGGGVLGEVLHAVQTQLPDALRTALSDHLWGQIVVPVQEWGYNAAQAAGVPLTCTAQTQGGPELITSVTVSIPSGATGLLQLGSMTLPVFGGVVTTLAPLNLLLDSTATRSVTSTTAGPVGLWLTGEQRPAFGVMSR